MKIGNIFLYEKFPAGYYCNFFPLAKEYPLWRILGVFPASILLIDDQSKIVLVPSSPLPMTDSGMHRAKTILTKENARECLLELLGKKSRFPLDVNIYVASITTSSNFMAIEGICLRMRPMKWNAEKRCRKTKAWKPKLNH